MKNVSKVYAAFLFCAVLCLFSCGNKNKAEVANEVEDTTAITDTANVMENVEEVDQTIETKKEEVEKKAEEVKEEAKEEKKDVEQTTNAPVALMQTTKDSVLASVVDTTATQTSVSTEPTAGEFNPGHAVSGSKLICLTFDDGPSNKTTPKVLDTMQKYGAHCTFFCVGSCITESTKHNLARAESLGCEVANHTYSHPSLTKISKEKQIEELNKTNEKIRDAVGHYPVFFRPPYLACNNSVLQGLSLVSISGTSSDDWVKSKTPERIVEDVMKVAKDGAIIVMHDLGANQRTPVALETLIPRLQAAGFTLVTVSELFAAKGKHPELLKTYTSVR